MKKAKQSSSSGVPVAGAFDAFLILVAVDRPSDTARKTRREFPRMVQMLRDSRQRPDLSHTYSEQDQKYVHSRQHGD
jgi:hypothetical protein